MRVHAGNSDFRRLFGSVLALEPVAGEVVAVVNEELALSDRQRAPHYELARVQPLALKIFILWLLT